MVKKTTQRWLSRSDDDGGGARQHIRFQRPPLALLGLLLFLCIPLVPLRTGLAAPLRQEMSLTFPVEGSTLSGQIDIIGPRTSSLSVPSEMPSRPGRNWRCFSTPLAFYMPLPKP